MLPRQFLRMMNRTGEPDLLITLGRREANLIVPAQGRHSAATVSLPLAPGQRPEPRIQSLLRARRIGTDVRIRLDSSLVYETGLVLPTAAERSLRLILGHQIERLVPLAADEVCFEPRIMARRPEAGTLEVRLVIARRETLERARRLAMAAGLVPWSVETTITADRAGLPGHGEPVTLWMPGRDGRSPRWQNRICRGLEAAILALAIAAYGLHVHRLDEIRHELAGEVGRTRQASLAVERLSAHVAAMQAAVTFLEERRKAIQPLQVLDELTRRVPHNSWVSHFTLKGSEVDIVGISGRATDLVGPIENSALLGNPRFLAPISLSPGGEGESFDLGISLKGGAGR